MTWTKLGDEYLDETLDLSDAAFRTHTEALMRSNRRLLDLLIPKREVRRFAGTDDPDMAVKELVEAGWWRDDGDAWWIGCRFAHWQQDRVQVENRRKGWAERQRRSRRHRLGDHSLCVDCEQIEVSLRDSLDEARRDPETVTGTGSGVTKREQGREPDDPRAPAHAREGDDHPSAGSDVGTNVAANVRPGAASEHESDARNDPGCDVCGRSPAPVTLLGARLCVDHRPRTEP